jgi:tubby-related protein 1
MTTLWNTELDDGVYRLNFEGRVKIPSVKNFQVCPHHSTSDGVYKIGGGMNNKVALQFGKVDKNRFHLDFRYPFTPLQALAVALSQFDI